MIELFDVEISIKVILFTCGVGNAIATLEYLSLHKHFKEGGLFSWKILRIKYRKQKLYSADYLLNIIFSYNVTILLLALYFIFLLLLILDTLKLGTTSNLKFYLLIVTFSNLILTYRNNFGGDGSDQMTRIIFVSILIGMFLSVESIALGFIAVQSCLSYLISGIAKFFSLSWRKGHAVRDIIGTRTYGHLSVRKIFNNNYFSFFVAWSIILFEITFPLSLILPEPILLIYIIMGIVFHVLNAFVMGLNTFVYAFISSYAAIVFVNFQIIRLV